MTQFRSKLDITEAYEQTCINPEEVYKTTFSTIFGTFQSHVIQMGDCNAPSTFQQLMTITFQDFIRKFIHVYLDDIFIFLNSLEEHLEHIIMVLQQLREVHFLLSKSKVDLFSTMLIVWAMSLMTRKFMLNLTRCGTFRSGEHPETTMKSRISLD